MAGSPKAKKAIKKGKAKSDGPKKPLSSYMMFMRDAREKVMKEYHLNTSDIGAVGKKMGELWNKMGDKEKAPYVEMAAKDKGRYEKEKAAAGK